MMSYDKQNDYPPPLAPIDSMESTEFLRKSSSCSNSSTRSSISNQLSESLEKTRSILKVWRTRSDICSSTEDNVRSVSPFPLPHDKDESSSSSLQYISVHDFEDLRNSSLSTDTDDEIKALDSLTSIITLKREKKNAALSKLQDMFSLISSHSDDSSRQNLSSISISSKPSSNMNAANNDSALCPLVFPEDGKMEDQRMEDKMVSVISTDIIYNTNIRVYDNFMILKL